MPHNLRILGSIDIAPAASRPRRIALLSYLLLARRPVRRQELAALLWPDADTKRARGSLNQLMVEMRRDFGAHAFDSRNPDEISIVPGTFTCDAAELTSLADQGMHAEVVAAYTGSLLDGFRIDGLDRFNDWVDATRRRIDDAVADAATRAASIANDPRAAIVSLEVAARMRPYDEAILRARMVATSALSGAAAATALFEEHRTRIAGDLALSPSSETRKLLFEICTESNRDADAQLDALMPTESPAIVLTERSAGFAQSAGFARASRFVAGSAIAACILITLAVTLMFALRPRTRMMTAITNDSVNVALLNFGDQEHPSIRALPGLVATYLIRDTSIDISYDTRNPATFQVIADLQSDKDEVFGTLQIRVGENVISTTAVRTSTRAGMDTIAAQLARYVTDVVRPMEHYPTPALAVSAARQHLLFARADFARGVRQNALFELQRATQQLDSVTHASRNAEWLAVSEAVAYERTWQRGE